MRTKLGNLFHLGLGILLLALGVIAFRVLGGIGKSWWQHESSVSERAAASSNGDAPPEGSELAVYGFLAENLPAKGDGANDNASAGARSPSPIDRISAGTGASRSRFLHGRLSVKTYQAFQFVIPPHAANPRLEGTFRALQAGQQSGRGCSLEVLLMTDDEFQKFGRNEGTSSIHSQVPATHADIEWDLAPTYGERQQYHLVFRNASVRSGAAIVDADFGAKFE